MDISLLVEKVLRFHYPYPPAPREEIDAVERAVGHKFPGDLRYFFRHTNGARLFDYRDSPYEILTLSEIRTARLAIHGMDEDFYGPGWLVAICDVRHGDYVGIDLRASPSFNHTRPMVDCSRATFPNCGTIAQSFSDFLEAALNSKGESRYWRNGL